MLAYIFWHSARQGVVSPAYRNKLIAFHGALNTHRPAGFLGSASFAVSDCPWLPPGELFEDWYFIEDFAALGILNQSAVTGPLQEPHHEVAWLAGFGSGGLYRLIDLSPQDDVPGRVAAARWRCWLSKPQGRSYQDFHEQLRNLAEPGRAAIWQRQLVLGPALEYCIHTSERLQPPSGALAHFDEADRVV